MKRNTTNAHPGDPRRMNRRPLTTIATAVIALPVLLTGCATNSTAAPPAPNRAQIIAREASDQIAQLQADEARRLREALALGENGDRAYATGAAFTRDGRDENAREQFELAVSYYTQAVSTYDQFFALWNNLGTALMELNRYQQAEEAFIQAAVINPADPRPLYNRGLLYRERGYPADARRYFERALEKDPNYIDALWGTIRADITLREESRQTLDRIRTALFIVTDRQHRVYLELERERIRSKLGLSESREQRRSSEPEPVPLP